MSTVRRAGVVTKVALAQVLIRDVENAQKAYDANATAVDTLKTMAQRALEILVVVEAPPDHGAA